MTRERRRRLDRSEPVVIRELGLHVSRSVELMRVTAEQEMSLALYIQTLLESVRDEDGNLPDLTAHLERTRSQEAAHTAA